MSAIFQEGRCHASVIKSKFKGDKCNAKSQDLLTVDIFGGMPMTLTFSVNEF